VCLLYALEISIFTRVYFISIHGYININKAHSKVIYVFVWCFCNIRLDSSKWFENPHGKYIHRFLISKSLYPQPNVFHFIIKAMIGEWDESSKKHKKLIFFNSPFKKNIKIPFYMSVWQISKHGIILSLFTK